MIQKQNYAGLCEKWVEDVTNASIKGDTAYDSWKSFQSNGGITGAQGMQPGDVVYFSPNQSNQNDGHVGIFNGNDYFTSATDNGVEVNNINDWSKKTGQQVLGYVPRSKLATSQGKGGGSMNNDPSTNVWVKVNGQYIQSKLSDVSAYGLDPNSVPPQNIVANNPTPPGGGQAGSSSPAMANPPAPSADLLKQNVGATLAKPVQEYQTGAQQQQINAGDLIKQSYENQIASMQKDKTLAPKVLGLDLQKKMTLEDATKKYVSTGLLKFDDVLNQYNAFNSTAKGGYGPAKQTQAQLDQLNPTKEGIQRKQDAVAGINLIRSLREAWQEYQGNPTDLTARNKFLSIKNTLTDPSSNYGKLVAQYRASFPDPNNPLTWLGADGSFQGAEETVLNQSGGYTYKMLGLDNAYGKSTKGKSGNMMDTLKGMLPGQSQNGKPPQGGSGIMSNPVVKAALGPAGVAMQDPLGTALTAAPIAATAVTGGANAPEVPAEEAAVPAEKAAVSGALSKITKPFMKVGKYLTTTQGKTVKQMEQAVAKGGKLDWETIVKNARQDISNKGVPAKKALEKLINSETPAQLGSPKLSSSEGFELRKGLGARMPSNVFEKALQKASTGAHVPNNQAIETLRRAVSAELKRAAPDIKSPDEMYTFIKNMKGDMPTWAKRVGVGLASKAVLDKLNIKGPGADFVELLMGSGGGML